MIEALIGKTYGPFPLRACREKVAEFVSATGDDQTRWIEYTPPGWAAAALFAVAPHLLSDPDLENAARSVIHGEQTFSWSGPIAIEEDLEVSGHVTKVRERGGVWFVGFDLEAGPLRGTSTFLMSGSTPPGGRADPTPERAPGEKETGELAASRADLIRYAAATRDWNPIHWDHHSAVEAGVGGIVVHGLLQAAWILRHVVNASDRRLVEARFRFRSPLLVGEKAEIAADSGRDHITVRLTRHDRELVVSGLVLA